MPSQNDLFEEKKKTFEKQERILRKTNPLKRLKRLPRMEGITQKTARFLRWKSLVYLLRHDQKRIFRRYFLRHPFLYAYRLLRSYRYPPNTEGDFFLCNTSSVAAFAQVLPEKEHLFVLGFSYCHKPFECPSGRFNSQCAFQKDHPVCGQCFIGKCRALAKHALFLLIPTVHYIGEKMMELVHQNPQKRVLFLITACEMSLRMFHDWGVMLNIEGLGVRLDGRICNTMRAFHLSERGIKPGLTVVLDETQRTMLSLLKKRIACETASAFSQDQKGALAPLDNSPDKALASSSHTQGNK
ncbi:MAG: hypothetical protein AAGF04_00845 [Chlamydiota bacterium]